MPPPKISVLVPTYNYARYLPETIESILNQDWQDLEILVSDDASTDNSAEIITRYAAKDSRIRFQVHKANLGMVQNWNWCLSQARGEYVKYLFGDDKFASRHSLRRLIQLLEDNPSASLAASARYVIGEDSEVLDLWNFFNQPGLHRGSDVIARCLDANHNLIGEPSVVLFRRRDSARGFNTLYRQIVDLEMWFHLLEKGDFAYVSEPLCCFRRHDRQQTEINKVNEVGELEALQLLAEYHAKSYLSFRGFRKCLFSRLYDLKKYRKRNAHLPDEVRQMERKLTADLGGFWYATYWLHRKTTKPIQNLHRWFRRQGNGHRLRATSTQALRQTERQPLRDRTG